MANLFKKTGVKLELITDYDMILMIEKGIRGRISQATHSYANNLYGWAMSQKLPVNDFKWVKRVELSTFNEDLKRKL